MLSAIRTEQDVTLIRTLAALAALLLAGAPALAMAAPARAAAVEAPCPEHAAMALETVAESAAHPAGRTPAPAHDRMHDVAPCCALGAVALPERLAASLPVAQRAEVLRPRPSRIALPVPYNSLPERPPRTA